MGRAEEIRRDLVAEGRFLKYENIIWRDKFGAEKVWETLERRHDWAEAVMIVPWISESRELVIIRQFRPPARGYIYEFPAGLIDQGETPEQAAERELREETGYGGTVVSIIPPTFNTPGMSGEAVYVAYMDLPIGQRPEVDLQDSEDITTIVLKREEIEEFILHEIGEGNIFDSKVFMYMSGLVTEDKIKNAGSEFMKDIH